MKSHHTIPVTIVCSLTGHFAMTDGHVNNPKHQKWMTTSRCCRQYDGKRLSSAASCFILVVVLLVLESRKYFSHLFFFFSLKNGFVVLFIFGFLNLGLPPPTSFYAKGISFDLFFFLLHLLQYRPRVLEKEIYDRQDHLHHFLAATSPVNSTFFVCFFFLSIVFYLYISPSLLCYSIHSECIVFFFLPIFFHFTPGKKKIKIERNKESLFYFIFEAFIVYYYSSTRLD